MALNSALARPEKTGVARLNVTVKADGEVLGTSLVDPVSARAQSFLILSGIRKWTVPDHLFSRLPEQVSRDL